MTSEEFESIIRKLNGAHKNFFNETRSDSVRDVIGRLPFSYTNKAVDKVLWSAHPPKIEWFQDLARSFKLREVTKSLDDFQGDGSVFGPDESQMIISVTKKRLAGQCSDAEWRGFNQVLRDMINNVKKPKCLKCSDTDYVPNQDNGSIEKCLH